MPIMPASRPDPRAVAAMKRRGYEAGRTRSRKFTLADFQNFDLILAMDLDNLAELKRVCPVEQSRKLSLFLDGITLDDESGMVEAPNPSHGNLAGFEAVLDLCEAGAKNLVSQLATQPGTSAGC